MKSSAEPHGAAGVELLKAVAQAWHAQSGNPRPSRASSAPGNDDGAASGARRAVGGGNPCHRPSRFKLEAAAAAPSRRRSWDFAQSLWDTYELVAVSQKLESSLVITDQAAPRAVAGEGAEEAGSGRGRAAAA